MNEFAYVLQAWLPLIVWQQVEAPKYRKGFITVSFLSAALIATAFIVRALHAREITKRRTFRGEESEHESEAPLEIGNGKQDVVVKT